MKRIVIGTRGSELALAQAGLVAKAIREFSPGIEMETRIIRTRGDQRLDLRLAGTGLGGIEKGLFTKDLETALDAAEIDLAVHSLKDLPTSLPEGFCLGSILPREDPADVLIYPTERPVSGVRATVGTSSPRRTRQAALLEPKWEFREIRGNVPTRLRSLLSPEGPHAIILALAGLKRLGLLSKSGGFLSGSEFHPLTVERIPEMLPAPGQGAVAVEILSASHPDLKRMLEAIHCASTANCVQAERALLKECGGGCHLALGALGQIEKDRLHLQAVYFPDETSFGTFMGHFREKESGPADQPERIAAALAEKWNL